MKCPMCDTENRENAKFCDECGFPLTGKIAELASSDPKKPEPSARAILDNTHDFPAIEEPEPLSDEAPLEDESVPSEPLDDEDAAVELLADAEEPQDIEDDSSLAEPAAEQQSELESTMAFESVDDPLDDLTNTVQSADSTDDAQSVSQEEIDASGEEAAPNNALSADETAVLPSADITVDLSGLDAYGEAIAGQGYRAPQPSFRDGSTMQMPRLDEEESSRSKTYIASATAPKPKGRFTPFIVAGCIIALIAAVVFGTYQMELWGGKKIENVVGMTQADATSVLTSEGFAVRATQVKSDDTEGLVLVMDPDAGARAEKGSEVVIHIACARVIPNIVGKTEEEAKKALDAEGFERVKFEKIHSNEPEGTVVSVNPEIGKSAKSSTEITICIAEAYRVPDVSGMYLEDAQKAIEEAGLTPNIVFVYNDAYSEGIIIGTVPAKDTVVEEGDVVSIQITRSRAAELEGIAAANLAPGSNVSIGVFNYQIESLDSCSFIGNNTVAYTITARPFISGFGETAYFSSQTFSGQVVFDDSNQVVAIV